ncbi:class I SAM-dependent methyltransferase [Beggiatoa leptomitoformis]|uniref:Methyltransferase domain-containing protein n=1 Tax=Beggiatoa leptomitoformis TaxID=288004 RepID=A0A2N9YAN1_9GAMM|nr:class I SAM-dependent methyltransferase [Beggiatoa leptomitoformis]ALG67096.1 methyltransferase domain-containing protein [Beggiatoa leptomitoformis]AUI67511.1 methyltransferase domain-containing protein [Beggiatoa leptomitoformis]
MSSEQQDSYDALPYLSNVMHYTQPYHIAAIAQLFGMNPPRPETARILELGCANGGNIVATAHAFPQATCVGIELSARQVAMANGIIQHLDLKNIVVKQMDILDFSEQEGMFDYIIAHGIYTWVTADVQEKILRICQQHLNPNGIAYISYNTKPGWNMRGTIRDMMLYHTKSIKDPHEKVVQMRALWQFLAETTQAGRDSYSLFLNEEFKLFAEFDESYLFHDFLEAENNPLYLHEFVEQASAHDLVYVGDTYLHTMLASNFPPEIANTLSLFKDDLVHQEQYMDFLRNRHFRHSLLCHKNTPLQRAISAERLINLYAVSTLEEVQDTQVPAGKTVFANRLGNLVTDNPIIIAGLHCLREQFPQSMQLSDLVAQVKLRLPSDLVVDSATIEHNLADILLQVYTKGLIELHACPLPFVITVSDKPKASTLAQWRITQGIKASNLRFETLTIEHPVGGLILPYLDGTRDRAALIALLQEKVSSGELLFDVKKEGNEVELTAAQAQTVLAQALEESLQLLARSAMLVA